MEIPAYAERGGGRVKALSIRQPWVDLILQGRKTLEIRSWKTEHRGETYLHSAFKLDRKAMQRFRVAYPVRSAIVGIFNLDGIEELTEARWGQLERHHLSPWPWDPAVCKYGFWISGARRIAARPCSGRSFIFDIEEPRDEYYFNR